MNFTDIKRLFGIDEVKGGIDAFKIKEKEKELRINFPNILREFYLSIGDDKRFYSSSDDFTIYPIDKLELDERGNIIITDNGGTGCNYVMNLEKDNPENTIFFKCLSEEVYHPYGNYKNEIEEFIGFLFSNSYYKLKYSVFLQRPTNEELDKIQNKYGGNKVCEGSKNAIYFLVEPTTLIAQSRGLHGFVVNIGSNSIQNLDKVLKVLDFSYEVRTIEDNF